MSKEAIQKGIDALRGVIAWDIMRNHLVPYRVRDPIHEAIEALAALTEKPSPVALAQEPVAWTLTEELEKRETTTRAHLWFSDPVNCMWTPLYTSPPAQRKPLTTREIREWWASENGFEDCNMSKLDDFEQVVRAIESKHGIKENT